MNGTGGRELPSFFSVGTKEEAVESSKGSAWTEHNKAVNHAVLRGVIAVYLVYLGGSLLYDLVKGTSSLSPVVGWTIGPLFVIAGTAFGFFTWRRWKADEKEVEKLIQEAKALEALGQNDPNEPV